MKFNRHTGLARAIPLLAAFVLAIASPVWSQAGDTAEALFERARTLVDGTEAPHDAIEAGRLREARNLLDRVVSEFPASDLAVRILIQDTIDGLDIARLDSEIAALPETSAASGQTPTTNDASTLIQPGPTSADALAASGLRQVGSCYVTASEVDSEGRIVVEVEIDAEGRVASLPELIEPATPSAAERTIFVNIISALDSCAPYGEGAAGRHKLAATATGVQLLDAAAGPAEPALAAETYWSPATEETQEALELSRREIAELQARLTVLGFDPNGIDGLSGSGTKTAITNWQSSAGIPATGFLDQPQMSLLLQSSESGFQNWLLDERNRKVVESASAGAAPTSPNPAAGNRPSERQAAPRGWFWYKGRLCRRVFGNAVISCR